MIYNTWHSFISIVPSFPLISCPILQYLKSRFFVIVVQINFWSYPVVNVSTGTSQINFYSLQRLGFLPSQYISIFFAISNNWGYFLCSIEQKNHQIPTYFTISIFLDFGCHNIDQRGVILLKVWWSQNSTWKKLNPKDSWWWVDHNDTIYQVKHPIFLWSQNFHNFFQVTYINKLLISHTL